MSAPRARRAGGRGPRSRQRGVALIMGLMMLAAAVGTRIEISASGPQRDEAMAALAALVEAGFHED